MDLQNVPQEGNKTLGGYRKAVYARDAEGHIVVVASKGWEVEEIVTSQAVEEMHALAEKARQRTQDGLSSPLEYWMSPPMTRPRRITASISTATGLSPST